ncbi:MAG TPA: siderophore-interacting protein [Gryllotalpicola sp.]
MGELYRAEVLRAQRVSPHLVRVTFTGDDLGALSRRGFEQWFRLFLPVRTARATSTRCQSNSASPVRGPSAPIRANRWH